MGGIDESKNSASVFYYTINFVFFPVEIIGKLWYYENAGGDRMIRIAIVDDEIEQIEIIKNIVETFFLGNKIKNQIYEFTSGEELLNCTIQMDLIFLDIQMDGIDGIETAQKIRSKNKKVVLFYVTNFIQEMSRSFSVHPFAFVEKPVCREKIYKKLQDFLEYTRATTKKEMITFKGEKSEITVCIQDIIYLEYLGNRKIKLCVNDNETIVIGSMKQMNTELEQHNFIQTHESFIVNESKIRSVYQFHLVMNNQDEIPIAQKRQKQIIERISYYLHHQLKGES